MSCVTRPTATFFVRAARTSIVDAGICPGDILVGASSLEAKHRNTVIAAVDGDFTVKELCLRPAPRLMMEIR
ncbi:S24 family peptidase [Alcanivorax jadensis]|uniref:S24 family peptidase n=1 Tax=Alcanivorax jadensis TaxID=64988 RepID=UPI0038B7512B